MSVRDQLQALAHRHGVDLGPELVAELEAMVACGETSEFTADVSQDTWYADAPTVQVERPAPGDGLLAGRYELIDLLGRGGMGEVHRARDHVLLRIVALKIAGRAGTAAQRSRFSQEAQATAQLDHPGIVPIYDYGTLDDGALYYSMPVVRGRTLGQVIREVHDASAHGRWEEAADGTSFRRLVAAFHAVCEAMAYAHDRGVIHRDLKPENVMLGAYGQTLVVDWGLAKVLGSGPADAPTDDEVVRTARSSSSDSTMWGTVSGTPHYMPPEQARGEIDALGPRSDVWSLGAILYELLTGRPPFVGKTKILILASVITRPPDPVREQTTLPLPEELAALVDRCLRAEPVDRPPNARVLADEVRAWLDGERRREQALALVAEADGMIAEVAVARSTAEAREEAARERLAAVEGWRPVADKIPGWTLEDEAASLRAEADRVEQQRLQRLRQALNLVPELSEAHERLAEHYRARHEEAERVGDLRRMAELETLLRFHDTGAHARYLEGTGTLALLTEPEARVEVRPYRLRDRRLVADEPVWTGRTPVSELELPAGSYLVTLLAADGSGVRYPVRIERGAIARDVAPGTDCPHTLRIPPAGAVRSDECLVPAGWFTFGGDPDAYGGLEATPRWVDAFVAERTPVTVGAFLEFLAALRRDGDPRFDVLRPDPAAMGLVDGPDGSLLPGPDAEGFAWEGQMPMSFVSYAGAVAYARWRADRDGLPWRLPTEVEWEKAAGGTDGRTLPWGAFLDPTWCSMNGSAEGAPRPRPVGSHPVDCSPYGLLDACGAITEWTSTLYRTEGPPVVDGREIPDDPEPGSGDQRRVGRGASFYFSAALARIGTRFMLTESRRGPDSGLRLVRSL